MKKTVNILIFITIGIIAFSYGVLVGVYQIPPYELLDRIRTTMIDESNPSIDPELINFDVDSAINISHEQDILRKRTELIDFIWKTEGFPYSKLPVVQNKISDLRYNDLKNLKQIDKIIIQMEYGVNSVVYHFQAQNSNNHLIIYHQGHEGDFFDGKDTIQFFLTQGYSVLAFSMPLLGMNEQPIVHIPEVGKIKLISHQQFILLESSNFSTIKYFVEPIAISLNFLDANFNYETYNMVGISGGGWTSTLYSAIDDRISASYSIAGSLPFFLRFESKNIGDYEQLHPELYSIANYLELYVMAAYGDNKKFVQIFNKYDPCCFAGDLYKIYEDEIKQKILKLGKGTFEIYLDDSHKEHKISNYSLTLILDSLKS
jgi:hypothetical protein